MTDRHASTPDAAAGACRDESPDVVEPEPEATDAQAGPGRRRRRWRRVLAALVVLACLAAGGVGGAEHYARGQVVQTVRAALPGLDDDAAVTTDGAVLPQLLRHELKTLSIRANTLVVETGGGADGGDDAAGSGPAAVTELELTNVTANLTGVSTADPYRVGGVYASGAVGFEELERIVAAAVPDAPDLTITPEAYGSTTEPGRMVAATTVLGVEASLTLEPVVTDAGGLELSVVTVNVMGNDIDVGADDAGDGLFGVGTALSYFGLDTSVVEIGPEVLPAGLELSQAYVARDGMRLTLIGSDVELAAW